MNLSNFNSGDILNQKKIHNYHININSSDFNVSNLIPSYMESNICKPNLSMIFYLFIINVDLQTFSSHGVSDNSKNLFNSNENLFIKNSNNNQTNNNFYFQNLNQSKKFLFTFFKILPILDSNMVFDFGKQKMNIPNEEANFNFNTSGQHQFLNKNINPNINNDFNNSFPSISSKNIINYKL